MASRAQMAAFVSSGEGVVSRGDKDELVVSDDRTSKLLQSLLDDAGAGELSLVG